MARDASAPASLHRKRTATDSPSSSASRHRVLLFPQPPAFGYFRIQPQREMEPPESKFHGCRSLQRPPRHRRPIAAPPPPPHRKKKRRRTCPTLHPKPCRRRQKKYIYGPIISSFPLSKHGTDVPARRTCRRGARRWWGSSWWLVVLLPVEWLGAERPETVGRVIANNIGELND